ncbi:gephyrin-like molybdotransferase Glp [Cellulomonas sp.]|uniref:molybdopterin molybdotransferase MoeA n=1 Tax=Cellulomonas sp. TaxID=40001 RepID=UPI00258A016C|nr:gephyrin-like molybdotransferase Glp [Cellulomonas sp.]MCR6688059.1 molybdopterin molybdotransferase MoeA [Cellulomonas sp.]
MRSVQDHLGAVLAAVGPVAPLDVALHDAVGCILARDLIAPRDLPAVAVAARDGYAVAAFETEGAGYASTLTLPVAHDLRAGAATELRLAPGQAVRVASGAPVPLGADAVVPLEETDRGAVRFAMQRPAAAGQHVRPAGADVHAGEVVLAAGTRLGARQIALAAALGFGRLHVHPTPRVVLLSVGDELAEPGSSRPAQGAVFEADGHALDAAVRDAGATPVRVGILPDDRHVLREALEDQLVRADLVVVTGGLSELAGDTVKDVLATLGTVRLDHVAMTPGFRHGFGKVGGERGEDRAVPLFALQGDPVAAQVSFEVFVRPALRAMAGHAELYRPSVAARASHGWAAPVGLRQFVPATVLGTPDEGYRVTPLGDPGAPTVSALAHANALAVVGEQDTVVHAGQTVHCLVLEG